MNTVTQIIESATALDIRYVWVHTAGWFVLLEDGETLTPEFPLPLPYVSPN